MVPLILSTFGIIFIAELPDKTALASLVLATRYPVRQVVIGACLAFLVQTLVAVVAGSLLQLLPSQIVRIGAGLGFLAFAVLALRRQEEKELTEEERKVARTTRRHWAPWMASFAVVFAAEWGDLTQLATAALVAHTGQPIPVAIGSIAALWSVAVIAAVAGNRLGRLLSQNLLNRVSAALFAVVGLFVIGSALTSS
ncbi:MAG: Ca2+/H+ antiporter, family [Chloroflexota bacterium]|jgi:putative Ca2+/H+ antiporter (TMEM165/GDT1 family)|nr:Ca2+/H+ antiporter, family [Chloroflexota bacterium]